MKLSSILLLTLALPAAAAVSFTLPGVTEQAVWTGLYNGNYAPTSTTTTPWGPIAADVASGSSATFSKTAGPAYFYGNGIYGWHTAGSSYLFEDTVPISNIETLVLQFRANQAPLSFSLSLNNGAHVLTSPDFSLVTGLDDEFAGDDYALQWDLRGYGPIDSYELTFDVPSSTVFYHSLPITIDTGNSFAQVIPEPASAMLGSLAAALFTLRRRKA